MAVPGKNLASAAEDSSSSDDEELKRCQEAVWETRADAKKGEHFPGVFIVRKEVGVTPQKDKPQLCTVARRSNPNV